MNTYETLAALKQTLQEKLAESQGDENKGYRHHIYKEIGIIDNAMSELQGEKISV